METNSNSSPTIQGMMTVLWEQVTKLVAGETTPSNVNAVVNGSSALIRLVRLQIDYSRLTNQIPDVPFLALPPPRSEPLASPTAGE